ncbi:hypothetical protein LCGC14_2078370 [marine sediment metagenome]|uniref:Uncharacterized protein n=1 Tax=marine sediment metagenome TaxID=412755 RepID=A0A0F9EG55_9ZZZZ
MQHIDEYLTRYEPRLIDVSVLDITCKKAVMDEVHDGKYVKYDDVKHFLELLAQSSGLYAKFKDK